MDDRGKSSGDTKARVLPAAQARLSRQTNALFLLGMAAPRFTGLLLAGRAVRMLLRV
jgi:hypothetical protein